MSEVSPAVSSSPSTWLRAALGNASSPRTQRLARAITFTAAGIEIGRKVTAWGKSRVAYSVALPATDDAYEPLHEWLVDNLPNRARRALVVRSTRRRRKSNPGECELVSSGGSPPESEDGRLLLSYDGDSAQTVKIDGHRVSVKIERDKRLSGITITASEASMFRQWERAVFTCQGEAARDAVVEFIAELAQKSQPSEPRARFYLATRWGDWRRLNDLPSRPLPTVVLKAGQSERIVADLTNFLASEKLYARVGLPWHRGYLLEGPPGTGKTSLAKALAEAFGLDVYYVPLSDVKDDTNLLQMFGNVDARSMLVLEDVDVVHAAKSRDDAESTGISLSGLLNALDGLVTPHGLITVMTTNDLSVLDPALVRAGRADMIEHLGFLDNDQASRLAEMLIGGVTQANIELPDGDHVHADMVEVAKQHLADPSAMMRALIERFHRHGLWEGPEKARLIRAQANGHG